MNWLETYRDRVLTAEQAVLQIKSNTRLFLTGNCSVPQMVLAALTERAQKARDSLEDGRKKREVLVARRVGDC